MSGGIAVPVPSVYLQDPVIDEDEASLRVTGSVGGRWEKPKEGVEIDTHKPVVSTWGVFERPKDMSKAFGGGKDPTLKKLDPEEVKRRDEETKAILRRSGWCLIKRLEVEVGARSDVPGMFFFAFCGCLHIFLYSLHLCSCICLAEFGALPDEDPGLASIAWLSGATQRRALWVDYTFSFIT